MMSVVFSYLKSNPELTSLIPSNSIFPLTTNGSTLDPCIVYSATPVIANEAVTQNRVELRIVSSDFRKVEEIKKVLMDMFHFKNKPGFQVKGETIYHSSLVGSGQLYDPETKKVEQFLFFNLISK